MKDDLNPAFIIQADMLAPIIQHAQKLAEIKNAAKRHAARMAEFTAWVDPENMAKRKEDHEARAAEALAFAKLLSAESRAALGLPLEDPPLPKDEDLPKHMRGQAPSTIRAMLRQEAWKEDPIKGWVRPKLPGITIR